MNSTIFSRSASNPARLRIAENTGNAVWYNYGYPGRVLFGAVTTMDITFDEVVKLAEQLDTEHQNLLIERLQTKQAQEEAARNAYEYLPGRYVGPAGFVVPTDKIIEFCQRQPIQKLSLFGSVLRDDFRLDSDVDMLVEFEPDEIVGYFELAGMEIELTEIVRRKVDLRTPAELSQYFRQKVVDTAVLQYAK